MFFVYALPWDDVCKDALGVRSAHHDALHYFSLLPLLLHGLCVLDLGLGLDGSAFGYEEVVDADNGDVGLAGSGVGCPTATSKDAPFAP